MNKNIQESSETTRAVCSQEISNMNTRARGKSLSALQFSHWLAGLIDGDGCLLVSKKGFASCEITVGERERTLLETVKSRLGGKITARNAVGAHRWRLHNNSGMIQLVKCIQGKCQLPRRRVQLERVCAALQLPPPKQCSFSTANAWLAGFYEAQGYFHVNFTTLQCSITLSQKDRWILEQVSLHLGGPIYHDKSWDGFLYSASSLQDISSWVKYFSTFPLRSWKQIQLHRFKRVLLYKSRGAHLEGAPKKQQKRFQRLLQEFRQF